MDYFPKRFGPLTVYSWGWDVRALGLSLVWSRCGGDRKLYVSRDGTPLRFEHGTPLGFEHGRRNAWMLFCRRQPTKERLRAEQGS